MNNEDITMNDIALDNAIDNALDLLESGDEMTDEQLDDLLSDEEVDRAVDDLLLLKKATLSSSPLPKANVESEWERFKARNEVEAPVVVEKHTFRHAWLYVLSGVAATLLAIFGYSWYKDASKPAIQGEYVLEAVNVTAHPVVTTDDGDEIELDGSQQHHEELAELVSVNNEPKPLTITIPRGQTYHITLSDGSEVWLNTDCRFSYPSRFEGAERRVHIEGEAYFKVAHDAGHPFIVETAGGVETKVLGTEFNVRSYSKADSRVTLIKGSVEVSSNKKNTVKLTPGMEATLTGEGSFSTAEVDVDSYIYWKEGFFYFDDITLENIMQDIGRWYNLNVVFQREAAKNYHMHFLADRKDGIEQVVKLLNSMGKVKVALEDNSLVVR